VPGIDGPGRSAGGLPPDEIVADTDAALAATEEAVRRFHDPSPGAMVRVAAAPCSPFSVSPRLMRETADLARALGVRMHTHLAETREEDTYCLWRLDGLAHDAIAHGPGGDPVAALVLGPPAPLELLLVGGTPVVDGGELRTVDAATATREVRAARQRLVAPS
jgi:hypothetical protein